MADRVLRPRQVPDLVSSVALQRASQLEGGLYTQLVMQTPRRRFVGLRGERDGPPAGDNIHREYDGAASLTWAAVGVLARSRLWRAPPRPPFPPLARARHHPRAGAAFLQIEAAIGAHGAHPF